MLMCFFFFTKLLIQSERKHPIIYTCIVIHFIEIKLKCTELFFSLKKKKPLFLHRVYNFLRMSRYTSYKVIIARYKQTSTVHLQ